MVPNEKKNSSAFFGGFCKKSQEFKTKFEKNIKISLTHTSEIQKDDRIALGFSGGQSSRCLLHVLDILLTDRSFKKTESNKVQKYFEMEIIHVDVSSLKCLGITPEKVSLSFYI